VAEVASAFVSIMPSAKGFGSKLDSQIGGSIDSSGKKAGTRFGSAMKAGMLGAAGVAVAAGAVAAKFLGGALGEAREAQVVGARTRSVIKSMGGASNVTAKQVERLAGAISAKSGIDDEAIQSGQNLLLTFGKVRNETGKGNDVFNQASKLMVDMSAAMGTDAKGSAIQLGKALNDPVKGITALSRVGVSFTEGQKEQIKALVETGDTMGAQKVILGELTKQFGGAAESMATPADKAKVAWGNFQESIGSKLLPVVDKLLTAFVDKGMPAITKFADTLGNNVGPVISKVGGWIRDNLLPVIQRLADWVTGSLVPALQDFGRAVLPAVKSALDSVKKGLSNAQPFFKFLGDVVTNILLPVLGKLARTVLPILGDAIEVVGEAFGALGKIGTALWNKALQPAFKFIIGGVASILDMWSSMLGTLAKVPGFGWAKKAADAMAGAATKAREMADGIKKIPSNKTVTITTSYITRNAGKERQLDFNPRALLGDGPKQAFQEVIKQYGAVGRNLMAAITKGIKTASPKTVEAARKAFDSLTDKLTEKRDGLRSALEGFQSDFAALADSVSGAFTGDLFNASEEGKTASQSFIDNLLGKKSQLTSLLAAFTTLQGWGLSPSFLSQLFASGNGALITELAGMGQAGATSAATLFGEVTALGDQLGQGVAQNDPVATRIDETNRLLGKVDRALSFLADDIGKQLNGAAAKAGRRGKDKK